jgi:hypothetical protein
MPLMPSIAAWFGWCCSKESVSCVIENPSYTLELSQEADEVLSTRPETFLNADVGLSNADFNCDFSEREELSLREDWHIIEKSVMEKIHPRNPVGFHILTLTIGRKVGFSVRCSKCVAQFFTCKNIYCKDDCSQNPFNINCHQCTLLNCHQHMVNCAGTVPLSFVKQEDGNLSQETSKLNNHETLHKSHSIGHSLSKLWVE